jgi:hypothetical protein
LHKMRRLFLARRGLLPRARFSARVYTHIAAQQSRQVDVAAQH